MLAASTIFQSAGGLYDFWIDFSVLCLYGIWCCLIVWSRVFQYTRKMWWIAVIAIFLIYSRYFTIISLPRPACRIFICRVMPSMAIMSSGIS